MRRRTVLHTTGVGLAALLGGCLADAGDDERPSGPGNESGDAANGSLPDDSSDESSPGGQPLHLFNYRDELARFTVEATADGAAFVSDTFRVGAAAGTSTNRRVATIPDDASSVSIEVTAAFGDREAHEAGSWQLAGETRYAEFLVDLEDDGTLQIDAAPPEKPA